MTNLSTIHTIREVSTVIEGNEISGWLLGYYLGYYSKNIFF
jgi:hypothetical protein